MTPCRTGVAPVSNFELLFLNELFREANEAGTKQRKENFFIWKQARRLSYAEMNAIEVNDLKYRYHDGTEALRGVSFQIVPGECVALLGPNGSGKSTLLLHLNGILPEKLSGDGAVKILGEPVTPENLETIRRQVGLVFQDPDDQLFCPTVQEDVAFGPQQLGLGDVEIAVRVQKALAQVGLAGFGRRATHHLSHGEKRRVCLAGVLACEPAI